MTCTRTGPDFERALSVIENSVGGTTGTDESTNEDDRSRLYTPRLLSTCNLSSLTDFTIPELPSGRQLELTFVSTWGDPFYVGLNGVDLFTVTGARADIEQVSSSCGGDERARAGDVERCARGTARMGR
jgi:hypothetical protein